MPILGLPQDLLNNTLWRWHTGASLFKTTLPRWCGTSMDFRLSGVFCQVTKREPSAITAFLVGNSGARDTEGKHPHPPPHKHTHTKSNSPNLNTVGLEKVHKSLEKEQGEPIKGRPGQAGGDDELETMSFSFCQCSWAGPGYGFLMPGLLGWICRKKLTPYGVQRRAQALAWDTQVFR